MMESAGVKRHENRAFFSSPVWEKFSERTLEYCKNINDLYYEILYTQWWSSSLL